MKKELIDINEGWLTNFIAKMLVSRKIKDASKNDPEFQQTVEDGKKIKEVGEALKKFRDWALERRRSDGLTNYEYYTRKGVFKGNLDLRKDPTK